MGHERIPPSAATGRGGEAWGGVRHRGASVLVGMYNITGIEVIKAASYLPPKGVRGQEHGVSKASRAKYLIRAGQLGRLW